MAGILLFSHHIFFCLVCVLGARLFVFSSLKKFILSKTKLMLLFIIISNLVTNN